MTEPRQTARRRIGLAVPDSLVESCAEQGQAAALFADLESEGVESLWVLDQISGRAKTAEPVSLLSFAAALTTRVRLGIAIYVGAARGPLVAAKSLTTLDRLSQGRLTVGVGLGAPRHYGAYGAGGLPPGKVLDAWLDGLDRLWSEPAPPAAAADDELLTRLNWDVADSGISPLPWQKPHPPIWVGGSSDRTYRRAVRAGVGWVGGGKQTFDEYAASVKRLRDFLEPGVDFAISKRVYLLATHDRAEADRQLRDWFGTFYNRPEMGAEVAVVGTPEQCVERLEAHYEAGANHLIIHPIVGTREQYDLVLGEVIAPLAARS